MRNAPAAVDEEVSGFAGVETAVAVAEPADDTGPPVEPLTAAPAASSGAAPGGKAGKKDKAAPAAPVGVELPPELTLEDAEKAGMAPTKPVKVLGDG